MTEKLLTARLRRADVRRGGCDGDALEEAFNMTARCHPNSTVWINEDILRVNGHRTEYLRESRVEAAQVGRLLTEAVGIPVDPVAVTVFVDLLKMTVKSHPSDVLVTTLRSVRDLLRQQPRRLTPAQIEQICNAARGIVTCRPA